MTFKEFLLNEGRFPDTPKRGSELRATQDDDAKPRAKRNKTNLPDERSQSLGRRKDTRSWKNNRKTQYK